MAASFRAGSVSATFDMDGRPVIQTLREVKGEAANTKKVMENELGAAGAGGAKSFFKELKGGLGKSSALGQSLKLAAGGGAIMGLTLAASELKGFADQINEIKKDFREGSLSAGELTEKIAVSIPVFGKFFEAGRAIREVFTGEKAEIERINEEAALTVKLFEDQAAAAKSLREILRQSAEHRMDADTQRENRGSSEREARGRTLENEITKREGSSDERLRDKIETQNAKESKILEDKQKELKRMEAEWAEKRYEAGDAEVPKSAADFLAHGAGDPAELTQEQQKELQILAQSLVNTEQQMADARIRISDITNRVSGSIAKAHVAEDAALNRRDRSELADLPRVQALAEQKTLREKELAATNEGTRVKITALEAAGKEEAAAILRIKEETAGKIREANNRVATEMAKDNISKYSPAGVGILAALHKETKAIREGGDAEFEGYRKTRHDSVTSFMGPTANYYREIMKLNDAFEETIINEAELKKGAEAFGRSLRESLGIHEGAAAKFVRELKDIEEALKNGAISADQARLGVKDAQIEKARTEDDGFKYHSTNQEFRRFEAASLRNPGDAMKSPLDQLVAQQKNLQRAADDTARNTQQAADTLRNIEIITLHP